jgi:hypothetical protein
MLLVRPLTLSLLSLCFVTACKADESSAARGRGLNVAPLSAVAQAHVYEAAVRAAFEVDDQSLSLLLDPRELPRDVGLAIGPRLPDSVGAELHRRGVTKGTCEPPLVSNRGSPRCTAALPGYVVRFSPIFTLRGDSVQVYLYAQKYDSPTSGNSDRLRFERAYQVVPRGGDAWRAVREGRVPKEIRGEPK